MKIEENMEKFLGIIREAKDERLKSETTCRLIQLLINNGVKIDGDLITELTNENFDACSPRMTYYFIATIKRLDFSEHDKQFKEKISELEEIINTKLGRWGKCGLSFKQILDMQEKADKFDKGMADSLPRKSIDAAKMLIDNTDKYSVSDLRQIAQHLLIYCDNAPEDKE